MKIETYNAETGQFISIITEEEFNELCCYDENMIEDYKKFLRTHERIKSLNEIWKIID